LDSIPGITWSVDTDNPDKILTVEGTVSAEEIMKKVKEAGYEISPKKKVLGLF
jgi:copper chaperone